MSRIHGTGCSKRLSSHARSSARWLRALLSMSLLCLSSCTVSERVDPAPPAAAGEARARCPDSAQGDPAAYDYLVFEGGGLKGVAYGGAVRALEELGHLHPVRGYAGSSSGAQAAALMAAGYSGEELLDALFSIQFDELLDDSTGTAEKGAGPEWINLQGLRIPLQVLEDVRHFTSKFGWFRGDAMEAKMDELLSRKTQRANVTFAELFAASGRGLRMPATCVASGRLVWFDKDLTPDFPVARAVRASCAVPFVYTPVEAGDHLLVDGGLLRLMPFNAFTLDSPGGHACPGSPPRTLALSIRPPPGQLLGAPPAAAGSEGSEVAEAASGGISSIIDFGFKLFEATVFGPDTANSNVPHSAHEANVHVVMIDQMPESMSSPAAAANVYMSEADKVGLIQAGYSSVVRHFRAAPPPGEEDSSAGVGADDVPPPAWLAELLAQYASEGEEGEGPEPGAGEGPEDTCRPAASDAASGGQEPVCPKGRGFRHQVFLRRKQLFDRFRTIKTRVHDLTKEFMIIADCDDGECDLEQPPVWLTTIKRIAQDNATGELLAPRQIGRAVDRAATSQPLRLLLPYEAVSYACIRAVKAPVYCRIGVGVLLLALDMWEEDGGVKWWGWWMGRYSPTQPSPT